MLNNILSNTSKYRVFHHIIEESPQLCISGHKVRHFTFLFDILTHTILKLGTSYCKKHGLLKNHMKNDLLITVLRESVKSGSFLEKTISISLSVYIFNLIKSTINNKIEYFQNIDLSTDEIEYYDYRLPLEHLKRDVLEIKAEYFNEYNFPEYSGEYFDIVERIDDLLDYRENTDINKIEESLTNIQNEILQLLNSEGGFKNDILDIEKQAEIEIQENIKIEESLKYEKEEQEKQEILERYEEYINFEKQQIDSIAEEYYDNEEMDDFIKTILKEIMDSIKETEESSVVETIKQNNTFEDQRLDALELKERIRILAEGINEFKIEFAVFQNDLYHFKKDIEEQRNRHYAFFLKHNIPWLG